MAILKNTTINDTQFLGLPSGTTAQQPGQAGQPSPQTGMIRYNTSINDTEYYNGSTWLALDNKVRATVTGTVTTFDEGSYRYHHFTGNGAVEIRCAGEVEYLIVGGGGGGGNDNDSGGGGAGGLIHKTAFINSGSYTITVGNGGSPGSNGNTSSAFGDTAGGGLAGGDSVESGGASGSPQSNAGGAGGGPNTDGGGGGGAGSAGFPAGYQGTSISANTAGLNGAGLYLGYAFTDKVGDNGWFASGGVGGGEAVNTPIPLPGGGGAGAAFSSGGNQSLRNAKPNTGGGGGGNNDSGTFGFGNSTRNIGSGGSGVVIVKYLI